MTEPAYSRAQPLTNPSTTPALTLKTIASARALLFSHERPFYLPEAANWPRRFAHSPMSFVNWAQRME